MAGDGSSYSPELVAEEEWAKEECAVEEAQEPGMLYQRVRVGGTDCVCV